MNRQLAQEWGQFLSGFSWDWFVTLTFRDWVKSFRAHRIFEVFVREIEKAAGVPIFWFRADEIGPQGGRFHIHGLFGNVAHLRRMYWVDRWNELAGFARILPFSKRRGAAYYCAKYVAKQFGDWDLSNDLRAFASNQPGLPLQGGQKPPRSIQPAPQDQIRLAPARNQNNQRPMGYIIEDYLLSRESDLSKVYKSEVTRGRGRFRDFGKKE